MALAPRSSLRSLVLLMSHGKPRLSSFFSSSSSAATTGVPPAAPGADAPSIQPPAPPGRSCPKLPVEEEFVLHPIPGGPRPHPHPRPRPRPRGAVKDVSVTDKALLNAPQDPSAYPDPDHGSDGIFEDPRHPVLDPSGRGRSAVTEEPAQCTQEHPEYPVTDSSTDKGPAVEHPAYTTPGYGSCSTPEPIPDKPPCGTSEDVKQRDVDPPPPAREGVGHRVVDPPRGGRGRRAPDEPEQCAQEHPKYPVPDSSSDKVCSSAIPPPAPGPCTPAAPDVQPPVTPAPPNRSGHKLPDHEESVVNPLPDPPSGNRLSPVIEEPAQCTLDNPKYPTPCSSSHKIPAHEELVIHPLPDPSGNRLSPVIGEPAQCTLDNPKYPTPDHGSCSPSEGASGLLEDPLIGCLIHHVGRNRRACTQEHRPC